MNGDRESHSPDCLALRPEQAAAALGVSPRTLFEWTRTGQIPVVRQGRIRLYRVEDLREFLASRAMKGALQR